MVATDLAVAELGSGPPLILLHGGGPGCSSTGDFAAVIPALAAHARIHAVDFHQYGDSPSVRIDAVAVDHHVRELEAVMSDRGILKADFMCQSLGGNVALALAARRPESVGRIVVSGSQPMDGSPPDCDWELGPTVRRELFAAPGPSEARMRSLIASAEWYDDTLIPSSLVSRRLAVALRHHEIVPGDSPSGRGLPSRLDESLAEVAAPVLLLWGEADRFASPRYAAELASRLKRAELSVIQSAAHHLQAERPVEYLSVASRFLGLAA